MKSSGFSLLVLVLSLLVGCGGSGGSGNIRDGIGTGDIPSNIVGGWGFKLPGTQCEEVYFFNGDSTFEINSANEIVSGTYTVQVSASGPQRYQLTLNITTDNLQPDCEGNITDETGFVGIVFMEFPSTDSMNWYLNQTDRLPVLTMETYIGSPNSIRSLVNAGADLQLYERGPISITGSTDLSNIRNVQWTQLAGPALDLSSSSGLELTATLPSVDINELITLSMEIELDNGDRLSDSVNVLVMDYMDVADVTIGDSALRECLNQATINLAATEVSDITSLACDGVGGLDGIDQLVALAQLQLPNNTISSLDALQTLKHLVQLDISGNIHLACSGVDNLSSHFGSALTLVADDRCVTSRPIELGAIGFDTAMDEVRNQLYVSVPTRNEIAVISTTQLRVVDRLALPGSPQGIDLSLDGTRLFAALRGTTAVAAIDIDARTVEIIPLADKTGHADTFDVIEGAPGQLFVSANPGSGGLAYIARIDLNQFNLASRVAGNRVIRAAPRFARSPDLQSLYVSEGFSPNSLYKLNLLTADAGIILEDDHGTVSGTFNMSVNLTGSRIALASGQVLRTGSFIEHGRVTSGISTPSPVSNTLFVSDSSSTIQVFDFDTLAQTGTVTTECTYGGTSQLTAFDNDNAFVLLQSDVVCLHGSFSRSNSNDEFSALRFGDLGLEECVINTATTLGTTVPEDIEVLDCSTAPRNILSLSNIDRLVNLRQLNLSGHNLLSLTQLSLLNQLETLTMQNSVVTDLSPLLGINSLASIDITGNSGVACSELQFFQSIGVIVSANFCTDQRTIELGGVGHDMAYDAVADRLFVSIPALQRISEIDIATASISSNYSLTGQPRGIDLSADRSTLFTALNDLGDIVYLDTMTGLTETVDISTQLDDDRAWDIAEISPDRILVSSNPSSNGIAYIVEVRRAEGNLAARVASNRIIRAGPVFATSTDGQSVYVGEGFSPNSLYKLDATDTALPIVLEDNHGNVSGTNHLTLNDIGSLIYLSSGQVLSTSNFSQVSRFPPGKSWLSQDGATLLIAEGETNAAGQYDVSTTAKIGRQEWGCDITNVQALQEIDSVGLIAMGDDLVCFTRRVPFP